MASGMARGASKRGRRVAFGDGRKIIWDHFSEPIFRYNENVARPGEELSKQLEWVSFYRGHRIYNKQDGNRWVWNYDFKAKPGEFVWRQPELKRAELHGKGFVVIEPQVPRFKSVAPNKQWPTERYDQVALNLRISGFKVVQFVYGAGHRVPSAGYIKSATFREAASILKSAALYIGPEGGLHHAAAALGVPAVVMFGGFIPPQVTGYDMHTNLTGGAEACGSLFKCDHCLQAMMAISVDEVESAARAYLK